MEMCFKFMNGREQNYKIFRVWGLLKRKFRCRPRHLGSREPRQSLKCSGSREVKLPGIRSSGEEWFAPPPVTEHHVLLAKDPKQLASGKGLPSCTARHLTVEQAVQCRHACNHRLQMKVHWRNHFLVLPSCFQKGVMGFFPSVWQSPNPFSSRGKHWRLGY